jgi:quercetin dioxygenase-like cupin family protein
VRHSDDIRVYELIWDDEDVNAWVICWTHDQDTGFHDHDESGAAVAVISGEVREDRLRLGGSPTSRRSRGGATFTVPPTAIHRVLHAGDQPAVTIHAYSPPLTRTGAYRVRPDGTLERESLSFEEELRGELALS